MPEKEMRNKFGDLITPKEDTVKNMGEKPGRKTIKDERVKGKS